MPVNDALLAEYDHEIATTRRFLERVPAPAAAWRPHPKSAALGELAVHLATLPWWLEVALTTTELELSTTPHPPAFSTVETLLATFDRNAAAGRVALAATADAGFAVPWALKSGGKTIFSLPRAGVVRSFVLSHLIHHRAQLGIYLRLRDVPLPSCYGPSADSGA
ncbi:MAG TPA: DinB family protein [Candidatus Methanoperedens sp.]|nr:DinB family protein [Candidatus Methanoperedens sp.]